MQINDALIVQLSADIKGLTASLNTAGKQVESFGKKAEKDILSIDDALLKTRNAVLAFGGAWSAWEAGKQVIEAGMQMQALENRMKAATGNADLAANSMAYVRAEAERLGLSFVTSAEGFSGFAASALRAGLTLDQTKDIFSGVSEAATAMHLPAENVALVFKALEQMAAKGTVSMEELKGQLGESLPGAFEIAAKAMGVTTAELGELMQKGQVMSADFLPKFAAAVRQEFGASLEDATNSAQAAFNRLENALFDLKARFANAGILDAVTEGVEDLTAALNDPQVQAGLTALAGLLAEIAKIALSTAGAIGNVAAQSRNIGKVVAAMHGINPNDVQRVQDRKADAANFQQRMISKYVNDFKAANPVPDVSGGYTLGGGNQGGQTDDERKAAERERKRREREAEAARKKAEREAEAQARERESLSGQVRDLGVSMGTPLDRQQAEFEDSQKLLEEALAKRAITKQKFDEMMAAAEADYREKQKEYVLDQFGSEADQEQARYEDKLKKLQEAKEAELLTEAEFNAAKEELEQQHLDNMSSIKDDAFSKMLAQEDAYREARKTLVGQTEAAVMGLLQTYANKNKTLAIAMLAFEKAKALASIIISTQVAAAKAIEYYGPTPAGFAAAAAAYALGATASTAVVAAGIQQASSLANGSDSSGKPGSAGTTFNSATGQYEQNTTGGANQSVTYINVSLQGRSMSQLPLSEVRDLIDLLNEAGSGGSRLVISST